MTGEAETESIAIPFGRAARALFALDPQATFLNHGSFGAPPRAVLAAQALIRARLEAQPVAFFVEEYPEAVRAAAARLAGFVGARGEDLAFVENATAGANAVLRSLAFAPGDEIVTTTHCYGAVRQVLRHVAATTGAVVVEADPPWPARDAGSVAEAVEAAIGPRAKLLVIDHIASRTALIFPVERIIRAAKARGLRVLVDGAHAPGQIALDVASLGADWFVGNAHKWLLAPKGCGFLWAAADARDGLHPTVISHDYGRGFPAEFDWIGTRDPSAWLAVGSAIDFVEGIGAVILRERNHALAIAAGAMLAHAWGTETGAAPALFGAMATVRLPGRRDATIEAATALRARLWAERRIEVMVAPFAGMLWARVSAQIYNDADDYARLAAALAG